MLCCKGYTVHATLAVGWYWPAPRLSAYHNDVTTGKDGTVTLTLPVDSYEVTEVSVPEPYVVSDAPTQTIWLGPGDEQQLIFENLKKPYLTLSKTEVGTDTPIPGTVFSIEGIDSDFKDEWVTGADGTVSGYKIRPSVVY